MRIRRLLQGAAAAAALISPLTAFAGTVTTAPLGSPAPTLAMPALLVLAITLIGVGIYRLRARAGGAIAGFALLAGVSLLAGLSYAVDAIVLTGDDCKMERTQPYLVGGASLINECPNPMKVVFFDSQCDGTGGGDVAAEIQSCTIGEILNTNEECRLPGCA